MDLEHSSSEEVVSVAQIYDESQVSVDESELSSDEDQEEKSNSDTTSTSSSLPDLIENILSSKDGASSENAILVKFRYHYNDNPQPEDIFEREVYFVPPSTTDVDTCFVCGHQPVRYRVSPFLTQKWYALPILPSSDRRLCDRHYQTLSKRQLNPFEYLWKERTKYSRYNRKPITCELQEPSADGCVVFTVTHISGATAVFETNIPVSCSYISM